MYSLKAQIESITRIDKGINLVYQGFATFQKGSQWAHCTDSKGLKEF